MIQNWFTLTASFIEMLIGICFHFKKLKIVQSQKDITWELEIYNSVVCIIYWPLLILFDAIKYVCPTFDESMVTGILQFAWFIRSLCTFIILSHSLNVALYKYYIIVIKRPIHDIDKYMELKYLSVLISFPILLAVASFFKNIEYMGYSESSRHLCQTEELNEKSKFSVQDIIFGNFNDNDYFKRNSKIFYIWTEVYCIIQFLLTSIIATNILEGFVYYKMFQSAKR